MRQFIWYSPEFDVFILQCFLEGCSINFEWDWSDLHQYTLNRFDVDTDPSQATLWCPIGEL